MANRLTPRETAIFEAMASRIPKYAPPPAAVVEQVLAELLARFGLRDEPDYQGFHSSVREFAMSVASMRQAPGKRVAFATLHKELLALAPALDEQYGVRPIDPANTNLRGAQIMMAPPPPPMHPRRN